MTWLELIRWQDVADVLAVALMAWFAIRYLRQTHARNALAGLGVLGGFYLLASQFELQITASVFRTFFAGLVVLVVVLFQDDLRRLFERLGSWRPGRAQKDDEGSEWISTVVRTVAALAAQRTGALIVVPRLEPVDSHLDGGVLLGGRISEPLLLSLFDASSPGHDGAILIRDERVERFAIHLPLSTNRDVIGGRGTRHSAALGLAERCDAITIVVSEERGTIAVASGGELHEVTPNELADVLQNRPEAPTLTPPRRERVAWVEPAVALLVAVLVWLVFVPGSDVSDLVVESPINVMNLPPDLELESIDPPQVTITLRGQRRDLVLAAPGAVGVAIDAYLARFGRRTFGVTEAEVRRPGSLSVVGIEPEKIKLSLKAAPAAQ